MTRAWKFLDERSRGIFSGFVWPTSGVSDTPGPWVESREVIACEEGIHACSLEQLAWWMSAQLWEIELAGAVVVSGSKMVATRGRLVRLVDAWPDLGPELAEWAVWRVRNHAVEVLTAAGSGVAGAELAAATSFDDLGSTAARIDVDPASAEGVAVAQVIDSVGDVSNPIVACHDAARAAGHRSSAADRLFDSYKHAFANERMLQSQWIVERLRLDA